MPESSKRKDATQKSSRPQAKGTAKSIKAKEEEAVSLQKQREKLERKGDGRSPRWWAPVMVALMIIGLIFMVVAYLFQGQYPIPGLSNGNINLWIGAGIALAGFLMTPWWK